MSNKVFVGGLSWDTTSEGLRAAFEHVGDVTEATVVTDRDTGRSRGFGFVTFAGAEGASRAVSELNGVYLDGRTLKVDTANERPPRRPRY